MERIITCGCGDTDQFATAAYKILFKNATPPISHSYETVEIAKWLPYLKALEKSGEKYAYYVNEEEMWDLLKGVRIR